jgi:hypothetical protein
VDGVECGRKLSRMLALSQLVVKLPAAIRYIWVVDLPLGFTIGQSLLAASNFQESISPLQTLLAALRIVIDEPCDCES